MSVGNSNEFEEALSSQDAGELSEAWLFLDRIKEKRNNEGRVFQQKLLEKRLKILEAALKICPPDEKIIFFGNQEEINRSIADCQSELSEPGRQMPVQE